MIKSYIYEFSFMNSIVSLLRHRIMLCMMGNERRPNDSRITVGHVHIEHLINPDNKKVRQVNR